MYSGCSSEKLDEKRRDRPIHHRHVQHENHEKQHHNRTINRILIGSLRITRRSQGRLISSLVKTDHRTISHIQGQRHLGPRRRQRKRHAAGVQKIARLVRLRLHTLGANDLAGRINHRRKSQFDVISIFCRVQNDR